jgi:hypothetical protein
LLPAWAVDELVDHWPGRCGCGHVFAEAERVACREPARHQVEELPQIAVLVTEHRCQRVRCPDYGSERTGELPVDVARSAFGPRLQAAVAALSVRNRARGAGDFALDKASERDADRRYAELRAERRPRSIARLHPGHPIAWLACP